MGLYDGIKDVAKVVQQADNIDLYLKLLDLGEQALDMQAEISRLKEENEKLKRGRDISQKVIRHVEPCITLQGEEPILYYCSHCWDVEQLLVQLNCNDYNGSFECPHCHMNGTYSKVKADAADKDLLDLMSPIGLGVDRDGPYGGL